VTSHPVSKLHKGRGRFRDPAPSSSDDWDAGIGGSAQGAPRRKQKRESPVAMVEDPGHPASSRSRPVRHQDGRETTKKGASEQLPHAPEPRTANNLRSALGQALTSLVAESVKPLKRKSTHPRRRTAYSITQKRTPILQPVTKEDMTTVNQSF
jgi:hypothetical protein